MLNYFLFNLFLFLQKSGGAKAPPPQPLPLRGPCSIFSYFLLLSSFSFHDHFGILREFEDKTEYQAFENYDISWEAACHPAFTSNKAENIHRPHQQLDDLLSKKNGALSVWTCTIRKFIITSIRRSIARLQSFRLSDAIFRNIM